MNAVHLVLAAAAAVFLLLYARSRAWAMTYARWTILLLACGTVLAPFLWLVAAAFKDRAALNEYIFFPPLSTFSETMNLENFRRLFRGDVTVRGTVYFWQYALNSLFVASASTVLQLVFCSAAGYALAKYEFGGKKALMTFMLGTMMIPGVLLFAPVYEMMVDLDLIDTYHSVVLPGVVSAFGIFLFRQAILGVPDEMLDAGRVDGCGELRIYLELVMPLVRPMSAAFCLITFLNQWNGFFGPSIFLHSQDKFTLPVILHLYLGVYSSEYGVFLAGTLLAIVPPAILFFALEKEFVSGLSSGAVKG